MIKVVLYMSMSLDGFITGPDDGIDHGLGVNGERLHDWLRAGGVDPASHRPVDGPSATVFGELMATGAVITGRRTFEFAGGWAGDHHDGVPIFVLTHAAPDEPAPGYARYVTDGIESCVAQAKLRPVAATSCCTAPRPRRSAFGPASWTRWSCS
jgi:dihydrofolate reductase